MFQTEFDFELPKGYVDATGNLQKKGVMRMATALDEIQALNDPRVKQNEAYLIIVLLARVVIKLGTMSYIDERIVESFYSADLDFLQDLYKEINQEDVLCHVVCPHCDQKIEKPVSFFLKDRRLTAIEPK